jgi:hypothetical protein
MEISSLCKVWNLGLKAFTLKSNCCDLALEGSLQCLSLLHDVLLKWHHEILKVHLISKPLPSQFSLPDELCCCGFRTPTLK